MMKRILMIAMAAALAVALAACTGGNQAPVLGEQEITLTVTVVYEDGSDEQFELTTRYTYLGDALLEAGLVQGDESSMGLMIHTINGVRADFALDNAWWQFFVNGESSMTGVSATRIDPTATYEFRFTPA